MILLSAEQNHVMTEVAAGACSVPGKSIWEARDFLVYTLARFGQIMCMTVGEKPALIAGFSVKWRCHMSGHPRFT